LTVSEIEVALLRLPDVPLMLMVTIPGAAVPVALSVNVLAPVVLPGLNEAVTPLGKPDADKLTLPLNPFCGTTVMVLVPVPPCRIVNEAGWAESPKVGIGVTVNDTVVARIKLPDVPVMVTFTVPTWAAELTVSVNVLLLLVVPGLKDAVTPLGRPDAEKLTLPLKPFCGPTEMVLVPLVACAMLKVVGDAESVNVGVATVSVTDAVLIKLPDVPVMTTFAVLAGALLLTLKVSVLVLLVAVGVKDALTPLGRPDADKLTLPLNPFCGMTEMVLVPVVPGTMLRLLGEADRKKLGPDPTQLFTRLATLTVPIPVAKSQPVFVP